MDILIVEQNRKINEELKSKLSKQKYSIESTRGSFELMEGTIWITPS